MEELLAQAPYTVKGLKRGDLIEGKISTITPREILVDIGSKSEGVVIDKNHTFVADFVKTLKAGDSVIVYVVNPEDESGQILLSLRKAGVDHIWETFVEAKKIGEPVSVRGIEANRGGLLVDCQGMRGFIPASQIDITHAGRPQELIGRDIQVKVIEVDQKNNRLIFSQKGGLNKEDEAKIRQKLAKIQVRKVYEATVVGITPFGLFMSIDGVEGLVHISEVAWEKIIDLKEHFKIGDKVEVTVLEVDEKNARLNLSIKQLKTDPYEELNKIYTQQKAVEGKIVKITNFGAFVKLKQGVEGLIHVSKIPPERELKIDEEVTCLIENLDLEKRKISLSLVLKEKPVGYK